MGARTTLWFAQQVSLASSAAFTYHALLNLTCLFVGWNHNISMYADSATPQLQSNQKFARMTHEYESINVPGLYFAGSLTHGKDRGRAVGGVSQDSHLALKIVYLKLHHLKNTAKCIFNSFSS